MTYIHTYRISRLEAESGFTPQMMILERLVNAKIQMNDFCHDPNVNFVDFLRCRRERLSLIYFYNWRRHHVLTLN